MATSTHSGSTPSTPGSAWRTSEEAEQAVRWAKFWPRGERGLNGGNRDGRFGLVPAAEYTAHANASTFIGIQIETASALNDAAEIAAVPDVDLLFVGPADLSQVLGVPGDFENPRCFEAIERIADICAAAKKPWGIVPRGPEYAAKMRAWGCQMFVLGLDIHVVHAGIRATKERYAPFFTRAWGISFGATGLSRSRNWLRSVISCGSDTLVGLFNHQIGFLW
jgi:4-hydroxy-2-oxoheptanedioate aldolase